MIGPLAFLILQVVAQWFGLVFSILMFVTALLAAFSLLAVPGAVLWKYLDKPKKRTTRRK